MFVVAVWVYMDGKKGVTLPGSEKFVLIASWTPRIVSLIPRKNASVPHASGRGGGKGILVGLWLFWGAADYGTCVAWDGMGGVGLGVPLVEDGIWNGVEGFGYGWWRMLTGR